MEDNIKILIAVQNTADVFSMIVTNTYKMGDIAANINFYLDKIVLLYFKGISVNNEDTPLSLRMENGEEIIAKELNAENAIEYMLGRKRTQSL